MQALRHEGTVLPKAVIIFTERDFNICETTDAIRELSQAVLHKSKNEDCSLCWWRALKKRTG